jgi:ParB-like nuclease domain
MISVKGANLMNAIVKQPTESCHADPSNPRKSFLEDDLRFLGASLIKKQLVPLIVRKSGMIVDGERRRRVAKIHSETRRLQFPIFSCTLQGILQRSFGIRHLRW